MLPLAILGLFLVLATGSAARLWAIHPESLHGSEPLSRGLTVPLSLATGPVLVTGFIVIRNVLDLVVFLEFHQGWPIISPVSVVLTAAISLLASTWALVVGHFRRKVESMGKYSARVDHSYMDHDFSVRGIWPRLRSSR